MKKVSLHTIIYTSFKTIMVQKRIIPLLLSVIFMTSLCSAQVIKKREFRGAWVHTIDQEKYSIMPEMEMKSYFISLLDKLKKTGINTILFQVRPEADAWYESPYEPWSRYITGVQGKNPGWDPLAFMVEECHKRNLDIHAWLNPYRVRNSKVKQLSNDHLYFKNRWWFVEYGNYIWFDPGIPACRKHIQNIVQDIVKRYDIDAIHMDDYFYPYPDGKKAFNDEKSFEQYGKSQGYSDSEKANWRRDNVNTLIRELSETIHETKPWVQFGVSPFGIYRNQKDDPDGSNTNGLTNYDGLYADVMLWVKKGWVDYIIPQLYWEIGHKSADYATLISWWSGHKGNVSLYIGQDVLRTIKPDSLKRGQLYKKMRLAAIEDAVTGHCFWPAYELEKNTGGIADSLRTSYFKYPAIHPANNKYDSIPPGIVRKLILKNFLDGKRVLSWMAPVWSNEMDKAISYVVYGFSDSEKTNIQDPINIVSISRETQYSIPSDNKNCLYIVTTLDRCHNESEGVSISVK